MGHGPEPFTCGIRCCLQVGRVSFESNCRALSWGGGVGQDPTHLVSEVGLRTARPPPRPGARAGAEERGETRAGPVAWAVRSARPPSSLWIPALSFKGQVWMTTSSTLCKLTRGKASPWLQEGTEETGQTRRLGPVTEQPGRGLGPKQWSPRRSGGREEETRPWIANPSFGAWATAGASVIITGRGEKPRCLVPQHSIFLSL